MENMIKKLAKNLAENSCRIKKGEHVLISAQAGYPDALVKEIVKEIYAAGAYPHIDLTDSSVMRELLLGCSEEQLLAAKKYQLERMQLMDAYIGISSSDNSYEFSDVPNEKMKLYSRMLNEVLRYRVDKTKWVILKYPNASLAQAARMSKEAFTEYFFRVSTFDYGRLSEFTEPLKDLMERTDRVRITGKGTDLNFSIKDIPVIPCTGECNIPDGEIFTAPVKDSVNGTLSYNTKNQYQGTVFENIVFKFRDGKITEADSNNPALINSILDTDDGSRYIGEFALGLNPFITEPMLDTLFDEKICGSFHFTPGAAYDEADNGNESALHWDLVCIQTAEYGGGEIYFDDVLIRKDGLFVPDELQILNPDNLRKEL